MTEERRGGFGRAVVLLSGSSALVPLAGLITAPVLTQALGVAGRGEVAAAVAPNTLALTAATIGLPEALTYLLARYPSLTRKALFYTLGIGLIAALAAVAIFWPFLPFLSGDSDKLRTLIIVGVWLAVPALASNLLRGAAAGRQMWGYLALERTAQSAIRVVALVTMALTGTLTELTAVITICLGPVASSLILLPVLRRPTVADSPDAPRSIAGTLLRYGGRIWVGSMSSILLGRVAQILFAPVSTVYELGLYIVAVTISDVPLILALSVRDVLFSVNSQSSDASRMTASSRLALFAGFLLSLVIGLTLPFWVGPLFGAGFEGAILPTWILLVSSLIAIPGFMVGAGVSALDRPGLRSLGLLIGLAVCIGLFLLLVPSLGAVGAALAMLGSSIAATVFSLVTARRVVTFSLRSMVIPHREDLTMAIALGRSLIARARPGR